MSVSTSRSDREVALFPGHSHLRYLIACCTCIQMWRGKTWEIWSRTVTSGRQRVDTQGMVPDKEFWSLFLALLVWGLEAGVLVRQHQYPDNFTVTYMYQTPWEWSAVITIGQLPVQCFPSLAGCSCTHATLLCGKWRESSKLCTRLKFHWPIQSHWDD